MSALKYTPEKGKKCDDFRIKDSSVAYDHTKVLLPTRSRHSPNVIVLSKDEIAPSAGLLVPPQWPISW